METACKTRGDDVETAWRRAPAAKPRLSWRRALGGCARIWCPGARDIRRQPGGKPGQQVFEWFIDGQDIHIYERYQDSAAALAHVQRFVENFASRFLSLCTPTRMSVYGEPSDELKAAISGFNPSYLGPLAGYARS
jgi:hypothetical protein